MFLIHFTQSPLNNTGTDILIYKSQKKFQPMFQESENRKKPIKTTFANWHKDLPYNYVSLISGRCGLK